LLLGLLFDPEDGGDVPSKRRMTFYLTTWRYIQDDINLHNYGCEDLKSYSTGTLQFVRFIKQRGKIKHCDRHGMKHA
jgi:hypothetical protein